MTCDGYWAAAARMTSPNGEPVMPAQGGGWLYNADPQSLDGCLLPLPGEYVTEVDPRLQSPKGPLQVLTSPKAGRKAS